MSNLTEGTKFDGGKNRLDLIPPELIEAVGAVLTFGAIKYEDRNWEKGMNWGRVLGAAKRHILAWEFGDRYDRESNLPHLAHAITCLTFLHTYQEREMRDFNDIPNT